MSPRPVPIIIPGPTGMGGRFKQSEVTLDIKGLVDLYNSTIGKGKREQADIEAVRALGPLLGFPGEEPVPEGVTMQMPEGGIVNAPREVPKTPIIESVAQSESGRKFIFDALTKLSSSNADPKEYTQTTTLVGPDGKPHRYGYNPKTNNYDRDMGESPESLAFVQTAEGIVPFGTKTAKRGMKVGDKVLSSEMITAEQQIGVLRETLDSVKDSYKKEYVGPISGRTGTLGEAVGGITKDRAAFYANLEQIKNTLVYLLSGKQINEQEYERLARQLPDRNLPEGVFESRMKEFDRTLNSMIKNRKSASGGYGVPSKESTIAREKGGQESGKRKPLSAFEGGP